MRMMTAVAIAVEDLLVSMFLDVGVALSPPVFLAVVVDFKVFALSLSSGFVVFMAIVLFLSSGVMVFMVFMVIGLF